MASEIERPRNCGECARMNRFHAIIDGVEYDGGCPEFGVHVKNTYVCHPNVGVKRRANESTRTNQQTTKA